MQSNLGQTVEDMSTSSTKISSSNKESSKFQLSDSKNSNSNQIIDYSISDTSNRSKSRILAVNSNKVTNSRI